MLNGAVTKVESFNGTTKLGEDFAILAQSTYRDAKKWGKKPQIDDEK
jgi:hypothetical protein